MARARDAGPAARCAVRVVGAPSAVSSIGRRRAVLGPAPLLDRRRVRGNASRRCELLVARPTGLAGTRAKRHPAGGRETVRRSIDLLIFAIAALALGCAPRHPEPEWVLVRTDIGTESGAPIYAWQEVRRFPNAEECAKYEAQLVERSVSAGSREKLEEVYRAHCLPVTMMQQTHTPHE